VERGAGSASSRKLERSDIVAGAGLSKQTGRCGPTALEWKALTGH
jgi:hypothetical protein